MGADASRARRPPRRADDETCITGVRRLQGRPMCFKLPRRRTDGCESEDPLDCLTPPEWSPILQKVCQTSDWPQCLALLAKGELSDSTKYSARARGRSVAQLQPELCAQLSKEECHTYGQGPRVIACRWHERGNAKTGASQCGALRPRSEVDGARLRDCWVSSGSDDAECLNGWMTEPGDRLD